MLPTSIPTGALPQGQPTDFGHNLLRLLSLRHPLVARLQLESCTDSCLNPGPRCYYSQKRQLIASVSAAEAPKHQRQVRCDWIEQDAKRHTCTHAG